MVYFHCVGRCFGRGSSDGAGNFKIDAGWFPATVLVPTEFPESRHRPVLLARMNDRRRIGSGY